MSGRRDPSSQDPRSRTEPVLGDIDHLGDSVRRDGLPTFSAEPSRRGTKAAAPPRPSRWPWLAMILAVIVIGGVAWLWTHQNALREDLPRTQLNAVLAHADAALAAGNLSGSAESARDQYEAALALDPDNDHAIAGLRNVGEAELRRAQDDIRANKLDDARAALEEARGLLGGGSRVTAIETALNKAASRGDSLDNLIDKANAALAAGNLDGRNGAPALFRRVLDSDPGNAVARHGMDQAGAALAARAQDQLRKGDLAGAQRTLDTLAALLPSYSGLPDLRAAVAQAGRDAQAQRDQHLAQGEADLRAGKFTGAGDDNALAQFQAVLAQDPGNAQARTGLGQVAQALIVQANAALDAGRPDDAAKLLDAAGKLAPKSADLAAARSRMRAAASASPAPGNSQTPAPVATLTPMQTAHVARLVHQADAAARQGELMLPPGDSAYDLYRAALAIDGYNAAAQAGLRALPLTARTLFAHALHAGQLDRAGDLQATLAQLSPGDTALPGMQQSLGSAWLDRARKLADQGRYDDARHALDEARRLTPDDPRIPDVDNRIGYGN